MERQYNMVEKLAGKISATLTHTFVNNTAIHPKVDSAAQDTHLQHPPYGSQHLYTIDTSGTQKVRLHKVPSGRVLDQQCKVNYSTS